ncbi:DUF7504 family protein [Halosimplex amylolyticum]|uniref:DUF7504 family protein n=1 Tax=Halosimplex amylolyticum TaxID=3396616 RepID=UPI003F567C24
MTDASDSSSERDPMSVGTLPQGLSTKSTVLVAGSTDPSRHAVGFQVISRLGDADDTVLAVTTTESADETVEAAESTYPDGDRPPLGVVDTASKQQSLAAPAGEVPVVYTPAPGDLERLVVGLTELSAGGPPATGARHLLVRSLTPVLATVPTDQVCSVLRQISGIRTDSGVTLVGVDYTAHDEATMAALAERVDGVLWVASGPDGALDLEYQPVRGRFDEFSRRPR